MPKYVGNLGKLIAAKGYKKLAKVQKITQSGHTGINVAEWKIKRKEIDLFILRTQLIGLERERVCKWVRERVKILEKK